MNLNSEKSNLVDEKKQQYEIFRRGLIEETTGQRNISSDRNDPLKELDFSKLKEIRAKALNL